MEKLILGAHVSIAGGFEKSVERTLQIEGNCMQIFTKSNRSWYGKAILESDAELFKLAVKEAKLACVVAHASYLINLASPKQDIREKSLVALADELVRCDQLGIDFLVMHPGSHVGSGVKVGVKLISEGINLVLEQVKPKTGLLLETMAGQGSTIGSSFQELEMIFQELENRHKVGFCFDTCHVLAAGYDISTPVGLKKVLSEFDKYLGVDKIKVVHLNDSKKALGCRVDRHANIGDGVLGNEGMKAIVSNSDLANLPLILETPDGDGLAGYAREIRILKSL